MSREWKFGWIQRLAAIFELHISKYSNDSNILTSCFAFAIALQSAIADFVLRHAKTMKMNRPHFSHSCAELCANWHAEKSPPSVMTWQSKHCVCTMQKISFPLSLSRLLFNLFRVIPHNGSTHCVRCSALKNVKLLLPVHAMHWVFAKFW